MFSGGSRAYAAGVSPDDIDLAVSGGTEGADYEFVYDDDGEVILNILNNGTFSISMKEGKEGPGSNRINVYSLYGTEGSVTPDAPADNIVLKLDNVNLDTGDKPTLTYFGRVEDPKVRDTVELNLSGKNSFTST